MPCQHGKMKSGLARPLGTVRLGRKPCLSVCSWAWVLPFFLYFFFILPSVHYSVHRWPCLGRCCSSAIAKEEEERKEGCRCWTTSEKKHIIAATDRIGDLLLQNWGNISEKGVGFHSSDGCQRSSRRKCPWTIAVGNLAGINCHRREKNRIFLVSGCKNRREFSLPNTWMMCYNRPQGQASHGLVAEGKALEAKLSSTVAPT